MHEERKSGRSGLAAAIVVITILLPVFYVLSIGPVSYILDAAGVANPGPIVTAVRVFYYPVIVMHENGILTQQLEWYVELWT